MPEKTSVIIEACNAIMSGSIEDGRKIIAAKYPFCAIKQKRKTIPKSTALRIFIRDGFIDRYSGTALVFPGTLRIVSELMPDVFPYHPHGRLDLCHPAWWYLFPSIDHIVPLAFGGTNDNSNLITTSNLLNMTKKNALLDDLGWTIHPAGDFYKWDGLLSWFVRYIQQDSAVLSCPYIADWYRHVVSLRESTID